MKKKEKSAFIKADSPEGQMAIEIFRAQYNKAGLKEETAQILNENLGFVAYLLAGIKRFSVGYTTARSILGKDFISPEDVMKSRKGIVYSKKQLLGFRETIPTQEILEWGRDNNCMLVAGPNRPMSFIEIRAKRKRGLFSGNWYAEKKEEFSRNDKVETKWYMVRKEGFVESPFVEPIAYISEEEFVLNAAEFTWAITTYKATRGVYLFEARRPKTSSSSSEGTSVEIGYYNKGELLIETFVGNWRNKYTRYAVARKLC